MAHGAGVQSGSRSTRRIQGRRPENRPEAHGADSASTPRRATIPRTGGQRPKDRQVLSTFLTQTVSSRSRLTLPTFLLASSSSTMRRSSPTTSAVSCSLDPSSGVFTLGRQTSLQLHCCTLIFEREPGSESLNTEAARLIDCIRRKRVTSYFAIPRTGTFPMRSFRSTAERLLMIRSRVIVFFMETSRSTNSSWFFSVTWRQPSPYPGQKPRATAPPAVYHLASWEESSHHDSGHF